MERYWDMTEKARSELTEDELKRLEERELMECGVLPPDPLVLVEEPPMPEPDCVGYKIRAGVYDTNPVAWRSHEEAYRSLDGSLGWFDNSRVGGYPHGVVLDFVAAHRAERSVIEVRYYSDELRAEAADAIKAAAEARAENNRRREAFEVAKKKADEAVAGMRDDWYRCCSLANTVAKVQATRERYLAMLDGDEEKADLFLAETFSEGIRETARAWFGPETVSDDDVRRVAMELAPTHNTLNGLIRNCADRFPSGKVSPVIVKMVWDELLAEREAGEGDDD